jgi:hypothetical protein
MEGFLVLFLQVLGAVFVLLVSFYGLLTFANREIHTSLQNIDKRLDSMESDIREMRGLLSPHVTEGHSASRR